MNHEQDRLTRIEGELRDTVESTRFLPAATVVVAALSFMLTTFVWRLIHQTAGVEAAVRESIVRTGDAGDATVEELARLRNDVAGQATATDRLEQRLARVESNANATLVGLDTLSSDVARQATAADQILREIAATSTGIGDARRQVLERITTHAQQQSADRDSIVREVSVAMQRIEQSMIAQAEDVREQQRQLEAAAERARTARQAMLHDATHSVSAQLDGLRQILDGLRAEAGAAPTTVGGAAPASTRGADDGTAAIGTITPAPVKPAAGTDSDVSAATPAENAADKPAATTEPEVAAREKDTATN
jgi:hypothetical protein